MKLCAKRNVSVFFLGKNIYMQSIFAVWLFYYLNKGKLLFLSRINSCFGTFISFCAKKKKEELAHKPGAC